MAQELATRADQDRASPSCLQHVSYSDNLDFDIPMSEMSDVSPDIQNARESQEFQPVTRHAMPAAVIKLIARPESAGDDMSAFTNKLGWPVVQPGNLGRARPKIQAKIVIRDHQPSLDNDDGLKTLYTSVVEKGTTGRADDSIFPDDIQLLPVIHPKKPSVRAHESSHDMFDALAKEKSSESNQKLDIQKATVTSTSLHGTRDDTSHGRYQDDKDSEAECFAGEASNATDLHKPHHIAVNEDTMAARISSATPDRNRSSSFDNRLAREVSIPLGIRNASRVQKSKPLTRVPTSAPNNHVQHRHKPAARSQPTEEDLLYLLMSRARQNKHIVAQDLQQHTKLRHQNNFLLKTQSKLQEALENVQNENDTLHVNLKGMHNDFDIFKAKYKKLRAWACEVKTDFSMLKHDSDQMKTSIVDLQSEHINSRERVREGVESCSQALESMQSIRQGLAETRKPVETYGSFLHKTQEQLAEKRTEFQVLKSVELQHRSSVQELSERQDRSDRLNAISQARLADALETLGQKLDTEQTADHVIALEECLQILKGLSNDDTQKKREIQDVNATMNRVEDTLATLQANIACSTEETNALAKPDAILSAIAAVRDGIQTMLPDMSRHQELKELKIRNEEMIKSQNTAQQLLETDLYCARNHVAKILEHNSLLVQQLNDKEQTYANLRIALTDTFQKELKDMQSKNDAGNKNLMKAQDEIVSYQARIDHLEQELRTDRDHHTGVNSELQAKHGEELRAVRLENSTKYDELVTGLSQQIQERDERITSADKTLRSKQDEVDNTKQELARALGAEQKLTQSLQQMQRDHSCAETDLEKERSSYRDLYTKYQNIEAQTSAIPNLKIGLEQKANAVSRLQADLDKLYGVDEQLQQARNELSSQQYLADELQRKLRVAEAVQSQVDELNAELGEREEEIETFRKDLIAARQQAGHYSQLEKSFKEKHAELVKMQSLLENVQQRCKKIPELESHNRKLDQQIKRQNDELQLLGKRADKIDELEHELALKDQTLNTYTKQLHDLHSLRCQLRAMRDQLQCKNEIIDKLKDENAGLKLQPSQCSGDDLADFFTQNTDLSIDSHTSDSSEDTNTQPVSGWAVGDESTRPQSGVDPRCIMAASPLDRIRPPKSGTGDSQKVVIPDSQPNESAEIDPDSQGPSQNSRVDYRISSPLSDVDEEFLEQESQIYAKNSRCKMQSLIEIEDESKGDNDSQHSSKSLAHNSRNRLGQSSNHRPGSAISQDEMLLSTVESKRQSILSALHTARNPHQLNRIPAESKSDRRHVGQSSVYHPTPRRLRGDIQNLGHSDASDNHPDDDDDDDIAHQQLDQAPREPTRPNSAIKRRMEQNPTAGSFQQQQVKRLKRPSGPLKRFVASSIESISTVPENDVPNSSATHRMSSNGIPTTSRSLKRAKAARKTSRQDKYAAQFGSNHR